MPYVTSAERIGMQKGLEQGRCEGIEQGRLQGLLAGLEMALRGKFGAEAEEILPEVRQLTDLAVIQQIYAQFASAASVADVRRIYR